MSYKGHDERTESICIICLNFGDCKHAREGKTVCNKYKPDFDDIV